MNLVIWSLKTQDVVFTSTDWKGPLPSKGEYIRCPLGRYLVVKKSWSFGDDGKCGVELEALLEEML